MAKETKIEKMAKHLNEFIRTALPKAFKKKFGVDLTTQYMFLADKLVSTRDDGQDFTAEQASFILAFETGYIAAMDEVHD